MALISFLLKASWRAVVVALVIGSLSGGTSAFLIALINQAIHGHTAITEQLLFLFLSLVILRVVTETLSQHFLARISQTAVLHLRWQLVQWILAAPLSHLETLGASSLLATLTADVGAISSAVLVIPFLCVNLALLVGCLAYLAFLSWQAFVTSMGIIILSAIVVQILLGRAESLLERAREEQDRLQKSFQAVTDGIKELKLNAARKQSFLTEQFLPAARSQSQANIASFTLLGFTAGVGELLFFSAMGLLIFFIPQFTSISQETLASYALVLTYASGPFSQILQMFPQLLQAGVALHKVEMLGLSLASQTEIQKEKVNAFPLNFHSIVLKEVRYTYPGIGDTEPFHLGPINLSIYPGELIFIVGGNGSGKSSLAKLITGLYTPESGEIYLDDQPVTPPNREQYRQLFSTVFFDFYLFDRLLGLQSDQLDEQVQVYLNTLQLEQKLKIEKGKFSTLDLSQGQRKRLALLTAYLEHRPVYLFDEWAADQDPYFREIFYRQLLPELKQRHKAILVISHDDRYFHLGDRLIKLDYGKIVSP